MIARENMVRNVPRVKEAGMKSVWVEGWVRWHGPLKSRMKILWTLWALSLALLVLWLSALVYLVPFEARAHLFLGGAFVMMGVCVLYGLKYCEFLEPRFMKWVGGSRLRHARQDTAAADPKAPAPSGVAPGDDGERTPSGRL